MSRLQKMLIRHEGLKLKPYRDQMGKLTIGVGRCLDDVGISLDEALMMLDSDIKVATMEAAKLKGFGSLNAPRQDVIISMIFNLGAGGFAKFTNLIKALAEEDYLEVSSQMLNSKWASQVGPRAAELAKIMRDGEYPVVAQR